MTHHPDIKKICVEAYLEYVKNIDEGIRTLKESIDRQRSLMLPSGLDYSGLIPSSSSSGDALANGVIKLQEMIAEYTTELAEYVEQQRTASLVFASLSKPAYRLAFTKYYLQGKTWEQVCVEMAYSYRRLMQIRSEGMLEVYDLMPEEWRRYSIPNAI